MNMSFSDGIRVALHRAREHAIELRHDQVGTEHLLLGVIEDGDVAVILRALHTSPEAVGREIRERIRPGSSSRRREMPYTQRAKKALEHAIAEAAGLEIHTVDSEHLLIAIAKARRGVAAEVLHGLGVSVEGIRVWREGHAPGTTQGFRVLIDDASDRSIYEQIVAQITEAVATGDLHPGERLPTVRQLADELDVAPGTVGRAYSELEREGLVVTEGARGTRIADRAISPLATSERLETLTGLLRPVAVAAFHLGATAAQLRTALDEAMRGILDKEPSAR